MLAGGRVHAAPADSAGGAADTAGGGGAAPSPGGGDITHASPPPSPSERRPSTDENLMVLSKVKIFSAAMKDHGESRVSEEGGRVVLSVNQLSAISAGT